MAKITNVSPIGDLDVPLLGRIVHAGETVEVTDDQAATLAAQASNWQVTTDITTTTAEAVDAPASTGTTITPDEPAEASTTAETPTTTDATTTEPEATAGGASQPTTTDTSTTSTEGSEH